MKSAGIVRQTRHPIWSGCVRKAPQAAAAMDAAPSLPDMLASIHAAQALRYWLACTTMTSCREPVAGWIRPLLV